MMKLAALCLALVQAILATDGSSISIEPTDGNPTLYLAAQEALGSFYCDNTPAKSCEFIFTSDDPTENQWNLVDFMEGDTECVKIVKANGYGVGESLGAKEGRIWSEPFGDGSLAAYMDLSEGPNKCWQVDETEDGLVKFRKAFGPGEGLYLRAPPVTFIEQSVSRARRFVTVSADDTENQWSIM